MAFSEYLNFNTPDIFLHKLGLWYFHFQSKLSQWFFLASPLGKVNQWRPILGEIGGPKWPQDIGHYGEQRRTECWVGRGVKNSQTSFMNVSLSGLSTYTWVSTARWALLWSTLFCHRIGSPNWQLQACCHRGREHSDSVPIRCQGSVESDEYIILKVWLCLSFHSKYVSKKS